MKKLLFIVGLFLMIGCESDAQTTPLQDTIYVDIEDCFYPTDKWVIVEDTDAPKVLYHQQSDISYFEDRPIQSVGGVQLGHINYDDFVILSLADSSELTFIQAFPSIAETQYRIPSGTTLKKFNVYVFDVQGNMRGFSIFRQLL